MRSLGIWPVMAREEMETLDGRFAPAGIFLTAGCLEDAKGRLRRWKQPQSSHAYVWKSQGYQG